MKTTFFKFLIAAAGLAFTSARATTFNLETATVADINAAIDAGALTSEKLVQLYLARIDAYDKKGPKVNAVITLNPQALEQARALDAERKAKGRRSPLHGIPIVIKDLIDLSGFPTTAGFKPFGAPIALKDAGVVARLKEAGVVIIAKVSTVNWFGRDGFTTTHPIGATLNPYNVKYSPGGSSNGPGVSMACYFATLAIGTDTGGSVQSPAAYCSVVGMVATQGLVTRTGIVPRGPTHDRAGPMGRSVYDISVLLSYMSGFDAEDLGTYEGLGHYPQANWTAQIAGQSLAGRRIGILRQMVSTDPKDAEAKQVFEQAVQDMRKAGALVVDPVLANVDLRSASSNQSDNVADYEIIPAGNVYLERLGPNRPYKTIEEMMEKVGKEKFLARYNKALGLPPPDKSPEFQAKYRTRIMVRKLIDSLIDQYDLDAVALVYRSTPPLADEPGGGGSGEGPTSANNLTSGTGLPGIIMPGGYAKENLPVGIQFVAKSFDDLKLLQVAYGYEQASQRRKTPEITPPLPGEKFDY
jgi:Asp-tRNA(Asn)/Glu-tRNA(Gln) amidotransferase A subunit family amidase